MDWLQPRSLAPAPGLARRRFCQAADNKQETAGLLYPPPPARGRGLMRTLGKRSVAGFAISLAVVDMIIDGCQYHYRHSEYPDENRKPDHISQQTADAGRFHGHRRDKSRKRQDEYNE